MRKKIYVLMMAAAMATAFAGCSGKPAATPTTEVVDTGEINQIPNPWVDYTNVSDAEKDVGFNVELPDSIKGYSDVVYSVSDGGILQAIYANGDKSITIRKAKANAGEEDISGDYNQYDVTKDTTVNDNTVKLKGSGSVICLATWTDGTYNYSVDAIDGISEDQMLDIVNTVR